MCLPHIDNKQQLPHDQECTWQKQELGWDGRHAEPDYSLAHLAVPYGGRQDAWLEPKYMQVAQTNKSISV
jgi:hypothetical protein